MVEGAQEAGQGLGPLDHPEADRFAGDLDLLGDHGAPGHLQDPVDRAPADGEQDPVTGELRLEAVGGVVGDDLAVVDDHDPLGHRVGLVQIVGGEHDGHAVLPPEAEDVVPQVGPALRVEAGGGLIEE